MSTDTIPPPIVDSDLNRSPEPYAAIYARDPVQGEPTWALVDQFPRQGDWTVDQYLELDVSRVVEFNDGFLEFLPMPTREHQDLRDWLAERLRAVLGRRKAYGNPFPLEISPGRFREPDVLGTNDEANFKHNHAKFADITIEIVSPGKNNRDRDEVKKRHEYAGAGIPEYWIVDPENRSIVVLSLEGDKYVELGCYAAGQTAESKVIEGFTVNVNECFDGLNDR